VIFKQLMTKTAFFRFQSGKGCFPFKLKYDPSLPLVVSFDPYEGYCFVLATDIPVEGYSKIRQEISDLQGALQFCGEATG
jgi:hypothetical protein